MMNADAVVIFNEGNAITDEFAQHRARVSIWYRAYTLWLDTFSSPATRRAYRNAMRDLVQTMARLQGQGQAWLMLQNNEEAMLEFLAPWDIGSMQIQEWKADLIQRELKPRTVANRLASVSSFFSFCCKYTVKDEDGREIPLQVGGFNPCKSVTPPKFSPYGASTWLDGNQLRSFFDAIMTTAARDHVLRAGTGSTRQLSRLRDYVLFMTYLCTARRNSEIRELKKGDIENKAGTVLYHWAGKRKERWDELPLDIFNLICGYLQVVGRPFEGLEDDDYLFTRVDIDEPTTPLTSRTVLKKMKRYAALAGLDAEAINVHTLRHSAAVAYKDQGGLDLFELSKFLGHSNIAVTQIYIDHMSHFENVGWKKVSSRFGFNLQVDMGGSG